MSFWYQNALVQMARGLLDWDAHDIRAMLVMTNTTADTEKDRLFISGGSGFTTLDEYDGANYARKAFASEIVNLDNANLRAELDADDLTNALGNAWELLGVGVRNAQGIVLLRHVTNDADSVPIAFVDTGGFPFAGNGGRVEVQWNAEAILQLQA